MAPHHGAEHEATRGRYPGPRQSIVSSYLGELVHGVVHTTRFQRRLTSKVFLVVVADIGSRHVLMAHARDALTDLLALHLLHVAQHSLLTEVLLRQIVH